MTETTERPTDTTERLVIEESASRRWSGISAENVRDFIQKWALLFVLALLTAGFSLLLPTTFATTSNFKDILNSVPPDMFIGFAGMLVLMVGEFDLSLGATLGFSGYVVLKLITSSGLSWPAAVGVSLAVGALIGLVNAGFIVGLEMNSFIATIGMATVLEGLTQWVSNGNAPIFTGAPHGFTALAQTQFAGIDLPVLYVVVVAVVLWLVTGYTATGRGIRAAGANRRAAFLSGLRTKRAVVLTLVAAGVLAAAGGILITAQVGAADATSGPGYLLPAYAAAFLGATGVRPGEFNVWGTVIAVLLVAVGITGLQLEGANSWVIPVFNGVVLLVAVTASMLANRRNSATGIRRRIRLMFRRIRRAGRA
jgi:ribose transport system permease protein